MTTSARLTWIWLLAVLPLSGCHEQTLPDPNDPNQAGVMQAQVLRRDLKGVSDGLLERREKGEIDDRQFQQYMTKYANELLSHLKLESVPATDAWEYGEVFRTAKKWAEAEKLFTIAVKAAPNQDRFVNDSLHLAEAQCYLGKVSEGLKHVTATFNSKPTEKAPILTGTLYQVLPAAKGKGDDVEVAEVLEKTIAQSQQTIVDPKTDPGKAFLMARPFQIRQAWEAVANLYGSSGHADLAREAKEKAAKASNGSA